MSEACSVCELADAVRPGPVTAAPVCHPCYEYERRTGRRRPPAVIRRAWERSAWRT